MANIFMLIKAKQIISILCLETIQHKRDGRLSEDIFLSILGFFVLETIQNKRDRTRGTEAQVRFFFSFNSRRLIMEVSE
jgi:hypothetical protein